MSKTLERELCGKCAEVADLLESAECELTGTTNAVDDINDLCNQVRDAVTVEELSEVLNGWTVSELIDKLENAVECLKEVREIAESSELEELVEQERKEEAEEEDA